MTPAPVAATLAAVLAPSCVADPNAFLDGLAAGALAVAALAALVAWSTRRR